MQHVRSEGLAVKTSPSKWACSITVPKMAAVDVTYKCTSLNIATGEEKQTHYANLLNNIPCHV
jgi:hypothetical protein